MILGNYLVLRENAGPYWIQRDKEGLIDLLFRTKSCDELSFSFDKESFEKLVCMIDEFRKNGKAKNAKLDETGRSESTLNLDLTDEEIRVKIDLEGTIGEDEILSELIIAGQDFKLSLSLGLDQIKELKTQLEGTASILEKLEKVQEEKTIPAHPENVNGGRA